MNRIVRLSTRLLPLVMFAALFVKPACADINLRVESRPMANPIEAFVRITEGGSPVTGLASGEIGVTLDGVAQNTFTFGLPPDQDTAQHLSIVFVIDYDDLVQVVAGSAIRTAVTDFINEMAIGDYAAIVKFRLQVLDPDFPPDVQSFTLIDGGSGTGTLTDFVAAPYGFNRGLTSVFGGLILGVDQFATPPVTLPAGPKAIIMFDDGLGNASNESQSEAVAYANANGIPVFTIGVGQVTLFPRSTALVESLAEDTGGVYVPTTDATQIANAMATVTSLLKSAYRLMIPQTAVTDCNPHMLEVNVRDQTESVAFNRYDTTPENFEFANAANVAPDTIVISDAATITGIEGPVEITVVDGEYSVGCGSVFTSVPGILLPDDEVCIRHTTAAAFNGQSESLLIVGGVSAFFISETSAAPPPPPTGGGGGRGGGGSTSVFEVLLALGAMFARSWRRH